MHPESSPSSRANRRRLRTSLVLVLLVYLLTHGGHTYSPDEEERYYVARGLLEQHRLAVTIPSVRDAPVTVGYQHHGRYYSRYGLGQSLVMVPFYGLGQALARRALPAAREYLTRLFVTLSNPLVTVAWVWVLMVLVVRLGHSARVAWTLGLYFALGTLAWPYAGTLFSEPLTGLGLTLGLWLGHRHRRDLRMRTAFATGLVLGLTGLVRAEYWLAAVLIYPVYLLLNDDPTAPGGTRLRLTRATLGGYALGLIPGLALMLAYNWARFGNILETGYGELVGAFDTPLWKGLYGLWLSPGRSVFLYAPALVLGLLGLPRFARRHRAETFLILAGFLFYSIFYARWFAWHGGLTWGPRLLVPWTALMILPGAAFLAELSAWTCRHRRLFHGLLMLAIFLVQVPAVSIYFLRYANAHIAPDADAIWFRPRYAPVVGHWQLLWANLQYWTSSSPAIPAAAGHLPRGVPAHVVGRLPAGWADPAGARIRVNIPPAPLNHPKGLFIWHWYPRFMHFDFWWWYWYVSGLPRGPMWLVLVLTCAALIMTAYRMVHDPDRAA